MADLSIRTVANPGIGCLTVPGLLEGVHQITEPTAQQIA
jgi:hypothetical protein